MCSFLAVDRVWILPANGIKRWAAAAPDWKLEASLNVFVPMGSRH